MADSAEFLSELVSAIFKVLGGLIILRLLLMALGVNFNVPILDDIIGAIINAILKLTGTFGGALGARFQFVK